MAKTREDALYYRLTPEQREEVLYWLIVEGKGYKTVAEAINAQGVQTSPQAVHKMHERYGLPWKLNRSKDASEELDELDLGDMTTVARQGIRKRIYEATFKELSVTEALGLAKDQREQERMELDKRRIDLETRKVALSENRFQWESASRVLQVVKEQPKLLRDLVQDNSLTEEQRIGRLIDALWKQAPAKEGTV